MDLGLPPDLPETPRGPDLGQPPDNYRSMLKTEYRNNRVKPDDYAQVRDVATELNLPQPVVARNKSIAESMAGEPDWVVLEKESPKTSVMLAQDNELFKLANDDIDNLSWWESVKRDMKLPFKRGQLMVERGDIGTAVKGGTATKEQLSRAGEITGEMQGLTGSGGFIEAASEIVGQMSKTLPEALEFGVETGMTLGTGAAIAGQAGPQAALPEEVATVPAAFVLGLGAGTTAKFAERAMSIEGGNAYLDMLDEKIDPEVAKTAATAVGIINAGLEVAGFALVAKPFKKALQKTMVETVNDKLKGATMRQALGQFAKDYGKAVGAEAATEVAQEVVNIFGEEIGKAFTDADLESAFATEKGRAELGQRLLEIFEKTAKGMAILGLPGASVNFAVNAGKARKAEKTAELFEAIGDKASASELLKRAPDKFKSFVESVTKDGDVETVYMDAKRFDEYFQGQGLDPDVVAQQLGVADQMADARVTGSDVEIPIATYAEKLAGSEFHQGLIDDLKFDSLDMSMREAEDWRATQMEDMQQEVDRIEVANADNTEFQASADQVQQSVKSQLMATERFDADVADKYAALHRAFAITMADRLKVQPHEVYERFGLSIQGEGVEGAQFDQSAFHGSPHRFTKFDIAKIGTGEGAQAYGYGLYFAESPGVAKSYQKTTTRYSMWDENIPATVTYKGKSYSIKKSFGESTPEEIAVQSVGINRGSPSQALEDLSGWFDEDIPADQKEKYRAAVKWLKEKIDSKEKEIFEVQADRGSLYEVGDYIPDAAIEKMLDWDAPLSEQAESVQKGIEQLDEYLRETPLDEMSPKEKMLANTLDGNPTGGEMYKALMGERNEGWMGTEKGDQLASEYLNSLGIPGIKYYDQQSRGPAGNLNLSVRWGPNDETAEVFDTTTDKAVKQFPTFKEADAWVAKQADPSRTRNFVVFDADIITVLKRDGEAVQEYNQAGIDTAALYQQKVKQKARIKETGEVVEIEVTAQEAINDIDQRVEMLRQLRECIMS